MKKKQPKTFRVNLRLSPEEMRSWLSQAKKSKMKLSEWIRRKCKEK